MTTSKNCGLVSPCINTRGVVCPRRNYSSCMTTCIPMIAFQNRLCTEECYMSSSSCENGPDLSVYFQYDGVVYR
jgi:hypothetical protein